MKSYSHEEARAIRGALRSGGPLVCPSCRVPLDEEPVPPNPAVSYVRRRLLVTCPSCHAHVVLDDSEDGARGRA